MTPSAFICFSLWILSRCFFNILLTCWRQGPNHYSSPLLFAAGWGSMWAPSVTSLAWKPDSIKRSLLWVGLISKAFEAVKHDVPPKCHKQWTGCSKKHKAHKAFSSMWVILVSRQHDGTEKSNKENSWNLIKHTGNARPHKHSSSHNALCLSSWWQITDTYK